MKDNKNIASQAKTNEKEVAPATKPISLMQLKRNIVKAGAQVPSFSDTWQEGVQKVLDGKTSNQGLEIVLIVRALAKRKIHLYAKDGKKFDSSIIEKHIDEKLGGKSDFWNKWKDIHDSSITAFFERGESRQYIDSVFSYLAKKGYNVK